MIHSKLLRRFFLFPLLAIFFTSGQTVTLNGRVTDFNYDTPVAGARITIYEIESGTSDSTSTNTNGEWSLSFPSAIDGENITMPQEFRVLQNYPNPFNPTTNLPFYLPADATVEIRVTNLLGQTIDHRKQFLTKGSYSATWKSQGSAGVYLYTIRVGHKQITRKMLQLDGGESGGLSEIRPADIAPAYLNKTTTAPLRIVCSKIGYHPDTLATTTDQTNFTTFLQTVHNYICVADMHNDISEQMAANSYYHLANLHSTLHTDIPRLQSGGMDAQIFAIWASPNTYTSGFYQHALDQYDRLISEFAASPEDIQMVRTYSALDSAIDGRKIAGIIFVEGGHHIENSLDNLINLFNLGVRGMTITWNNSTDWAVSARDNESSTRGLSDFGRQVISTMDSLGMIIDVSHVGIQTITDILATTKNPIIASHSNARALCNNSRNLTDSQMQAIAAGGGIIGVCFYPYFLTNLRSATLSDVIDHINYIVNLIGIDHVGIGSDFDGIEVWPTELTDVSKFPLLTAALLEEGYKEAEVEKIMGGNFLRIFRQVCACPINL